MCLFAVFDILIRQPQFIIFTLYPSQAKSSTPIPLFSFSFLLLYNNLRSKQSNLYPTHANKIKAKPKYYPAVIRITGFFIFNSILEPHVSCTEYRKFHKT